MGEWYYSRDGGREGPFSLDDMKLMAANGQVRPTDLVWTDGMAEWQIAAGVAELFGRARPVMDARAAAPVGYYGPGPGVGQSYNGMAIAGFVLSLTIPVLGLIFSWVALSGMKRTGNREGHGLALAGLIISFVWVGFVGLVCLWMTCAFGAIGPIH